MMMMMTSEGYGIELGYDQYKYQMNELTKIIVYCLLWRLYILYTLQLSSRSVDHKLRNNSTQGN